VAIALLTELANSYFRSHGESSQSVDFDFAIGGKFRFRSFPNGNIDLTVWCFGSSMMKLSRLINAWSASISHVENEGTVPHAIKSTKRQWIHWLHESWTISMHLISSWASQGGKFLLEAAQQKYGDNAVRHEQHVEKLNAVDLVTKTDEGTLVQLEWRFHRNNFEIFEYKHSYYTNPSRSLPDVLGLSKPDSLMNSSLRLCRCGSFHQEFHHAKISFSQVSHCNCQELPTCSWRPEFKQLVDLAARKLIQKVPLENTWLMMVCWSNWMER